MSSEGFVSKIKPLSNSNYPEWSGEVRAWLMKNGLWRLVSGKESKPSGDADCTKWEAKAERAAGEIYLLVENDQRVHFRGHEEDPVKMWTLLESAHLSKKPGARFNAYDDLFNIRKEDDESLMKLGVRIEKAMATIQNLRPENFDITQLDNELQCMALIRALPEDFSHLTMSLLLQDKLDKDIILQAFRSEELNRQRHEESANRAKAGGKKHKVPKDSSCYKCKKKGHWANTCPLKDKEKEKGSEGANKAEEERAEAVTEFAGKAGSIHDTEANATSSNTFHWNTDTGATSHMTPHRNWIRNYTPYKVPIRLADNTVIYSQGMGTVLFRPVINGKLHRDVEFARVLHVPDLCNNLLAVLYLTCQKGFNVHILSDRMEFHRQGSLLFTASVTDNGIGYLNGSTVDIFENVHLASTLPLDLILWHRRLAHHNYAGIKRMINHNLVDGLTLVSKTPPDPICEPCLAGKMHANPFPSSEYRASQPLELVHSDLHQLKDTSIKGFKYWITFIDDYSRFKVVIPLKLKSGALAAFKDYKAWAENQTGRTIKGCRCDKGGEYMSNEYINYLNSLGIYKQYTVRNRPQQNGVAEHANRTLAERITAMLDEASVSRAYWVECLAALVHVHNRCESSAVEKTPYEMLFKQKPDVSHLKVWGCLAYVHVQKDKRASNLSSHMEKCIFIGYPEGYKGWQFYNPKTKKVVISERADFDERYNYYGVLLKMSPVPNDQLTVNDAPSAGESTSENNDNYQYLTDEPAAPESESDTDAPPDPTLDDDNVSGDDEEDCPAPV